MKPSLKRFKEVAKKCNGNISAMATAFVVYRSTIYDWMDEDEQFKAVVEEYRGRLFDKCLKTAELLANGVPIFEMTEKEAVFAGWKVQPDGNMLRYLISTLGRKDGFGEAIDVTSNGERIIPEPITIEIIDERKQVKPKMENIDGSIM